MMVSNMPQKIVRGQNVSHFQRLLHMNHPLGNGTFFQTTLLKILIIASKTVEEKTKRNLDCIQRKEINC